MYFPWFVAEDFSEDHDQMIDPCLCWIRQTWICLCHFQLARNHGSWNGLKVSCGPHYMRWKLKLSPHPIAACPLRQIRNQLSARHLHLHHATIDQRSHLRPCHQLRMHDLRSLHQLHPHSNGHVDRRSFPWPFWLRSYHWKTTFLTSLLPDSPFLQWVHQWTLIRFQGWPSFCPPYSEVNLVVQCKHAPDLNQSFWIWVPTRLHRTLQEMSHLIHPVVECIWTGPSRRSHRFSLGSPCPTDLPRWWSGAGCHFCHLSSVWHGSVEVSGKHYLTYSESIWWSTHSSCWRARFRWEAQPFVCTVLDHLWRDRS